MRKLIRSQGDGAIAGVNIVPVIDLCLVLLVILLIISPMLDKPPVEVNLPKAMTKEEKENNITITVDPSGKMALNTDPVTQEELPKFLKVLVQEQGEDVIVVIRADEKVKYGELTELLKIAKTAGAKRISLGTEQPKEGEK